MIALVSENTTAPAAPPAAGPADVPDAVRAAGPRAVESYLAHLLESPGTGRKAALGRFLRWCGGAGLALADLRAGHFQQYFEGGPGAGLAASTKAQYLSHLRTLFARLERDGVLPRSPLRGAELPWRHHNRPGRGVLSKLDRLLDWVDGYRPGGRLYRPGLVALFPHAAGSVDTTEIVRVTGLPPDEVEAYAARLRESGVWTADGKVVMEHWVDEPAEFQLECVLVIGCAAGIFQRFPLETAGT